MPNKRVSQYDSLVYSPSPSETGSEKDSKQKLDKVSEEYKKRRMRNNIAVRKCRNKNRQKAKETIDRVMRLRKENEDLQQRIQILSKELSLLKDLFIAHDSTVAEGQCSISVHAQTKKLHTDHEYSITHKPSKTG